MIRCQMPFEFDVTGEAIAKDEVPSTFDLTINWSGTCNSGFLQKDEIEGITMHAFGSRGQNIKSHSVLGTRVDCSRVSHIDKSTAEHTDSVRFQCECCLCLPCGAPTCGPIPKKIAHDGLCHCRVPNAHHSVLPVPTTKLPGI